MTALTFDETAEAIARRLEDRERIRCGVSLSVARRAIARRTGVAFGTLENLRRGRIKGVREWIANALRAALIADLEAELARAEHELTVLKATHRWMDDGQIQQVETDIASIRRTLTGGEP